MYRLPCKLFHDTGFPPHTHMSDLTCMDLTLFEHYPQREPCDSTLLLSKYSPRDCRGATPVYVYMYVPNTCSVMDVLQLPASQDVTNPSKLFFHECVCPYHTTTSNVTCMAYTLFEYSSQLESCDCTLFVSDYNPCSCRDVNLSMSMSIPMS